MSATLTHLAMTPTGAQRPSITPVRNDFTRTPFPNIRFDPVPLPRVPIQLKPAHESPVPNPILCFPSAPPATRGRRDTPIQADPPPPVKPQPLDHSTSHPSPPSPPSPPDHRQIAWIQAIRGASRPTNRCNQDASRPLPRRSPPNARRTPRTELPRVCWRRFCLSSRVGVLQCCSRAGGHVGNP